MNLKYYIKKIVVGLTNLKILYKIKRRNESKKVYLLCVPQYINYGDYAIQIAEEEIIQEKYLKQDIFVISSIFYDYYKKDILKSINAKDLITITGGGWIGDLWPDMDRSFKEIVKAAPENKIILFPQTFYYEKNSKNLTETKMICEAHKDLYLCVREKRSYDLVAKEILPKKKENIMLLPDIVMTLKVKSRKKCNKNKMIISFRNDKERTLSAAEINHILKYATEKKIKIKKVKNAYPNARIIIPNILGKKLALMKIKEYSKTRIIITDRLHVMIFAAITGTPCVAFDNLSNKISESYKWIEHLEYIYLAKDIEVKKIIERYNKINEQHYDNSVILKEYDILRRKLE